MNLRVRKVTCPSDIFADECVEGVVGCESERSPAVSISSMLRFKNLMLGGRIGSCRQILAMCGLRLERFSNIITRFFFTIHILKHPQQSD